MTTLTLVAALLPQAASGRDLMLDSDTELGRGGQIATGLSFTALTLLSLGYAVYSYNLAQDELDKADKDYEAYQDATTEEDAVELHGKVEDHHDKAKTAETRANIAIALTLVFALTAFYSFSPDSAPNFSVTATTQGPVLEWRF